MFDEIGDALLLVGGARRVVFRDKFESAWWQNVPRETLS